jgi:hypothetical protein
LIIIGKYTRNSAAAVLAKKRGTVRKQESWFVVECVDRVSELQWVWNGVHSALVRINEELLERKVAAPA